MTYMVYVHGKTGPSKEHTYMTDAVTEAERLAAQPDNKLRKIYILKVEKVNEPVITRTWKENQNG